MGDSGRVGGPGQPVPDDGENGNGEGMARARAWAMAAFGVFVLVTLGGSVLFAYGCWR